MLSAFRTDRPPLTFSFLNIGPIETAELELGDLTLIAGRNNTGKTYLVYTLYGFLTTWQNSPPPPIRPSRTQSVTHPSLPVFERIIQHITEDGRGQLPVDPEALSQERHQALTALTRRFSEDLLAQVFSSPPEKFQSASIGARLPTESPWHFQPPETVPEPEDRPSIRYHGGNLSVVAHPPRRKPVHPSIVRRRLWRQYLRFLFPELPSDPFVLSAERFGIALFYRELDFKKSQIVDLLQKYGDRESKDPDFPFHLIDETVSRYALPIKDNIDYTRSIPDLRRQKSDIYDDGFFKDIRKLMDGYYAASSDTIEFRSVARGDRRFAIPLHLASSSARGLSDLYFFLRHAARRNHLLIIDEPESHLDTANQILLARLLARLVRGGLKVLLTTHSDYLIKEINNLIMLSCSFKNKYKVVKKLKYARDDCIAPERIRAYVAAGNSITKCGIDKFGIDMPHFDETINTINDVANELAIRLAEEPHD